ncbi:hypothetical protein NDU88_005942 [Pleurodeles waltl]|uniref:Uncharacterized protein n=1 Tax=Pleurodeles waltl TaxID=8319 RepID=A0AAV7ULE1_PLEWA|nr:hypothetical protein NDU88_005942 [Pleurodeles waltl]
MQCRPDGTPHPQPQRAELARSSTMQAHLQGRVLRRFRAMRNLRWGNGPGQALQRFYRNRRNTRTRTNRMPEAKLTTFYQPPSTKHNRAQPTDVIHRDVRKSSRV